MVTGVGFPDWLGRFNRLVTNPVLRPVATWAPFLGVIVHRGRVSGRAYRTPVNVFEDGDEYLFALTYGPDRDWVKNVLSQGRFTLVHGGLSWDLVEPRLQEAVEAPAGIPRAVRTILRGLRVNTFLRARRAPT